MLVKIILVGLGSGIGALSRYKMGEYIKIKNKKVGYKKFPIHTFVVNLLGAFLLAIAYYYMKNDNFISLIQVGFCGGFTTYSTMFCEVLNLSKESHKLLGLIYLFSSILLGCLLFLVVSIVFSL